MTIIRNNQALSLKKSRITVFIILLLLTGIFSSCVSVGPDYTAPQAGAPESWHTKLKNGLKAGSADPASLAQWWTSLNDPVLSELISKAVKGNLVLEQTKFRVREARARYGISKSSFFPTLDSSGAFSRVKASENSSATGISTTQSLYNAGFSRYMRLLPYLTVGKGKKEIFL